MIFTILLFTISVVLLQFFTMHYGKLGRIFNSIPGPLALPIVGNLYAFQISSGELWNHVRTLNNQYYPIFRLWSFFYAMINIRHPNDMETILGNTKSTKKSLVYDLLMPWFGTGLLTSAGRKWQTRRKILTPAFHFNVLKQFVDVFIEESEHMIRVLKSEGDSFVKDLVPFISAHTLNIICETAMGCTLKDKAFSFQQKYRKAVQDMGNLLVWRFVKPWFYNNFIFQFVPKGRVQKKLLGILHGFTKQIIKERKDYHEQTDDRYLRDFDSEKSSLEDDDVGVRKKRLAMLDLLIAAHRNNQIDDEGIREEVDTFMFRGHDTTGMSICFTIMLLAEHKEIQEKARTEVNAVMQENGGKMTMSGLQSLSYLERCIKESLRLYPSVPFISRAPETEVKLNSYVVPPNTIVHLHILDLHRDPYYWPNPLVYDPDRFLPDNIKTQHPYAYVPFSAGPRNCIGQRFAMLELKTTLSYILHNFYLEPVDYLKDVSFITDLTLRTSCPLRTRFVSIDSTC